MENSLSGCNGQRIAVVINVLLLFLQHGDKVTLLLDLWEVHSFLSLNK